MSSWFAKTLFYSLFSIFYLLSLPALALDYRSIESGLDYATLSLPEGDAVKLHLLRVNLEKYRIKVLDARDYKAKTLSVKKLAKEADALAAINANFFDLDEAPLGLVLVDGKIKNPPKNVSWWSALLFKGNQAVIAKISDGLSARAYDNAIQAGPRLVIAGRVPKLKEETSPKSAVGIDPQGRVIFIASEGHVSIQQLARILAEQEKKGGAGLTHVLNLDGGSSTQFYAKVGELDLWIPGLAKVPVALGVFRKSP